MLKNLCFISEFVTEEDLGCFHKKGIDERFLKVLLASMRL